MFQKLQQRWGVAGAGQVLVILLVFACTGLTAMWLKRPLFAWLGIGDGTPWWARWGVWLVTILPTYQVLLLFYGFVFGQFRFFWNFEKRMFRAFRRRNSPR